MGVLRRTVAATPCFMITSPSVEGEVVVSGGRGMRSKTIRQGFHISDKRIFFRVH